MVYGPLRRRQMSYEVPLSFFAYCIDAFLVLYCVYCVHTIRAIRYHHRVSPQQIEYDTLCDVHLLYTFAVLISIIFVSNVLAMWLLQSHRSDPLPRHWIPCVLTGLVTLLYILDELRKLDRHVQRCHSLCYIVALHDNVTYYNAEALCDEYALDVFPVKTYQRLYRENPLTSLHDLAKQLDLSRHYTTLNNELKASHLHMQHIRKSYGPPLPVQC